MTKTVAYVLNDDGGAELSRQLCHVLRTTCAPRQAKRYWTCLGSYVELSLTRDQAETGHHSGACDDDIEALRRFDKDIAAQLDALNVDDVREELQEYGAWDEDELADHDANLSRILFLACGQLCDEMPWMRKASAKHRRRKLAQQPYNFAASRRQGLFAYLAQTAEYRHAKIEHADYKRQLIHAYCEGYRRAAKAEGFYLP